MSLVFVVVSVFDASQYAFFGKDVVEEVELGGLEDEEQDLPVAGFDEEEFLLDREEVPFFSSGYLLIYLSFAFLSFFFFSFPCVLVNMQVFYFLMHIISIRFSGSI